MDLYTATSYRLAERLTKAYSTSFSLSSSLFEPSIRSHIFAIYGMVRLADEIVDTYQGTDSLQQLDKFEQQVLQTLAMSPPYSTNPIIHAFCITAKKFGIKKSLITPFFASMREDLTRKTFSEQQYETYIYGSAEVIGLMCLRVFTEGDEERYKQLAPGAQALGKAYQKVNFLRDIAADWDERQRFYFPNTTFAVFDETAKREVEADIAQDFANAHVSINQLPQNAHRAVTTSELYYQKLLERIKNTPATTLKTTRIRVPNAYKIAVFARAKLGLL